MAKNTKPSSFESAMAELEALIADMEHGEQVLESALAAYKRGGELVRFCQEQLAAAEKQVQILDGDMLKPLNTEPEL